MHFRILQSKLLFLHHLETLSDDSLAKEVYDEQKRLELPGLVQECTEFWVKFGITRIGQYNLNISEARLRFKLKAKMTPTIQKN